MMTKTTESTATTTTVTAATQGAQAAQTQATPTRKASQKKAAPKAKAARKTTTAKATKPAAKTGAKKVATKTTKRIETSVPREFSKRAVIIEMLHAKGGASLDEIVKKTSWQRHTVRGLLSTLRSKSGLAIERFDRDGGGHAYRITSK